MQLQNPFPLRVRLLFALDCHACFKCRSNGNKRGGLEIHHIYGRVSACAFNASVLCGTCHFHILHDRETHAFLFRKTLEWLLSHSYLPTPEDTAFVAERPELEEVVFALRQTMLSPTPY